MINYIALATALLISGVSAYYSVVGLVTLFSGSFIPVLIMGASLETGKLVTVSWLYRHWKETPKLIKGYLLSAIAILMLISSLGIYGFLSKAHIEQQVTIANTSQTEIEILDNKISIQKNTIADIDKRIAVIDDSIRKMIDSNKTNSALSATESQKKNRELLNTERNVANKILSDLLNEKAKKSAEIRKLEAEVGPLKYVAELIFSNANQQQLERAVRLVIIIIIIVFDPLAIVLLIAANHGFVQQKQKEYHTIHKNDVHVINMEKK